jgi:hypothetical protein
MSSPNEKVATEADLMAQGLANEVAAWNSEVPTLCNWRDAAAALAVTVVIASLACFTPVAQAAIDVGQQPDVQPPATPGLTHRETRPPPDKPESSPRKPRLTLRCWQQGKLIVEMAATSVEVVQKPALAKYKEIAGVDDSTLRLVDLNNALCVLDPSVVTSWTDKQP